MSVFERLGQSVAGVRNRDQVDVIGHQAVAQQGQTVELGIVTEQVEIGGAIGVAGENDLSSIAALRNMMRKVYDDDARQAGHLEKISESMRVTAKNRR